MSESSSRRRRRRRFGVICLVVALVMLGLGETALRAKLAQNAVLLVVYWVICLVLTGLAAMAAIVDAARVRRDGQEEQRTLIEQTLQEVEREKRQRTKPRS